LLTPERNSIVAVIGQSMNRRGHPLRFHIATAFTALVLAIGVITAWLSYSRSSRLLETSAVSLATRSTREGGAELERVLAPVRGAVRLLALQPVVAAPSLATRMQWLDSFIEALRLTDTVVSYYIGYADGDFFLVRRVAPGNEATFGAPPGTRFVVQSVERGGGEAEPVSRFIYLDERLGRIGSALRPQALAFDPRVRPWYVAAMGAEGVARTDPYVFFTNGKIGSTVAVRARDRRAVVAADVELDALSQMLARQRVTPSSQVVLFDNAGRVMGRDNATADVVARQPDGGVRPATLGELGDPALSRLATFDLGRAGQPGAPPVVAHAHVGGRAVMLTLARLDLDDRLPVFLGFAIPTDELLGEARKLRNQTLLVTVVLIMLAVLLALWLAYLIARPLSRLAAETEVIRHFDFSRPIAISSAVREVDDLAITLDQMKSTMGLFLEITAEVAAEADFERLLPRLLEETARAVGAEGGMLYLVGSEADRLYPAAALHRGARLEVDAQVGMALSGAPFGLAAAIDEHRPVVGGLRDDEWESAGLAADKGDTDSVIAVPLFSRAQVLVGGLVLFSRTAADPARLAFIAALSGFAAVSLEARGLIRAQKALFDAFLRLLAGAIDAKSPYTGGHCARVPELARMLAQAACAATEGPYRDFRLDPEQWEALHLAAWMHDWGKVTTPEYVVDKATKLETVYDRIHEVRTRFEVLKRDAEAACWRAIAAGEASEAAQARLRAEWQALDDDFAFVANCNLGGESMTSAQIERLHSIARRSWLRTLDDRLGIGHEELARKAATTNPPLPVSEPLLADKPEHRIERRESERFGEGNPWGFRMEVPELLYNRGELYNLSIGRGTLTAEERFKISEHVIQTIIMLNALPFPRHLAAVPEFAGGHHEKTDGSGYPKRLGGEQMSPVARMIAIADIFEALTAVDRPYKLGKTLSETLAIMARMRDEHHIDAELFELFLRAGVFRQYAERFMRPGQIDTVEIERYLGAC
jgi:HD-GYP domain-containing protein (c-di-GMP phosphodiesterase class II)